MLNENIKESIDKLIAKMRNFYDSKQTNRTLAVYFEQMKVQYESIPETIPADLYFPEEYVLIFNSFLVKSEFFSSKTVQNLLLETNSFSAKESKLRNSPKKASMSKTLILVNQSEFFLEKTIMLSSTTFNLT